jgi:hypothetical protein
MLFSRESGGAMSEASEQQLLKPLPPELLHDHGGNAEMRWEAMSGAGYATPNDRFYVRNHGPTPSIDVASWTLRVKGPGVSRGLSLSYEDLLALPAVSVTRALECAGNRRIFFGEQEGREAEGMPWRLGVIGVVEWTGVQLRPLLEKAGLEASVEYSIDAENGARQIYEDRISPAPGSASLSSGKQRPESTNCGCERPTLRAISSRRACRTTSRATSTTPSSPTRLQFINRHLVHLWRPLTVRYLKR